MSIWHEYICIIQKCQNNIFSPNFMYMKKTTFYAALALLITANLIVFACKKENLAVGNTMPSTANDITAVNRYTCDELAIFNGQNLIVCGPDGSGCQVCGGNYGSFIVTSDEVHYPMSSGVFYMCNPTGSDITCFVNFGCAILPSERQSLTIPAYSVRTYHLVPGVHCCVAVLGCM